MTHGSFCVIQRETRSPSRATTTSTYSANASAVSLAGQPPAVLERLRQIPVVEGRVRLDAVREQLVDEAVVVVEPGLVHGATALGDDPRPRDREAVRVETELPHEAHVLRVAVVRVAGHPPVSPLATRPGSVVKRSQMLSPRPSSFAAPSVWYAAVAAPQANRGGKTCPLSFDVVCIL